MYLSIFLLCGVCPVFYSVVCVGGDGMFTKLLNGLIDRKMSEAGKIQDVTEQPISPDLRIGIIPAGRVPIHRRNNRYLQT